MLKKFQASSDCKPIHVSIVMDACMKSFHWYSHVLAKNCIHNAMDNINKLHYRKWLTLWSMFAKCFCGMSSALPSVIARGVPSVDLGDPQITGSHGVRWWTVRIRKRSQTLTKRWSRPCYHSGHTYAMLRRRRNCRILGNTDFSLYCAAALQTANKVSIMYIVNI